MSLEDILAIDTSPVDEEIIHSINETENSYGLSSCLSIENWVRSILFYRYIRKFAAFTDIFISLPAVRYCLSKKEKEVNVERYVAGWRSGNFARGLFTQVMTECNWQYMLVTYNGKNWRRMPETGSCRATEWKSALKLAKKMRKIIKPNYHNANYYIFWNYHLAWYLEFRKCNLQKVKKAFSEGDEKIEELLGKICSPLCIGFEENFYMLDTDKCLLGLFEGKDGGKEINFRMMDYLFLIRIVVLDKLLKYARELFEKEEKT